MTRVPALASLFVGVGLAAGIACSGASEAPAPSPEAEASVPPPTPTSDAATVDATLPVDAARVDGGVPYPGDWKPFAGLPATCGARISTTPSLSIPPFPWKRCDSGRPSCEIFIVDWDGGYSNNRQFDVAYDSVYEDALGVHITHRRRSGIPVSTLGVTHLLHGAAETVAYSYDSGVGSCSLSKMTADSEGSAFTIGIQTASRYETWAAWSGPTDRSTTESLMITDQLGGSNLVQRMGRAHGMLALEQTSAGLDIFASAFRLSDKTLVPTGAPPKATSEHPVPVPGGYFYLDTSSSFAIGYASTSEVVPFTTVARPEAGRDITWFGVDRAAGNQLVWIEQDTVSSTIYASPFTTSAAGLVRRPVAKLANFQGLAVVNAGTLITELGPEALRMIRLSDGLGWNVAQEPGRPMLDGLWVNSSYVWAYVANRLPGQPGYPVRGGAVRIERASLGAPTIPSGL